jgi:hypothetical protein
MSRLKVQRYVSDDDTLYCPGEMFLDENVLCVTLEPGLNRPEHPAIPSGTYHLTLAKYGEVYGWMKNTLLKHAATQDEKETAILFLNNGIPLLENVPGRGGIEIHIGNKEADTLGCTLLGTIESGQQIQESTAAYFKVYPTLLDYIQNDTDGTIDYLDAVNA